MRRLVLSVLFAVAASTAAYAIGPGWHGPGWYVVMNTPVKQNALYRGSYPTKEACEADRPADHGSVEYDCVQFNNEPLDD